MKFLIQPDALVGWAQIWFQRLDELMKHRLNGTAFPSAAILTLCAMEFDAADTDTSDATAASRRRHKSTPHENY